jgi:hypothetical protein
MKRAKISLVVAFALICLQPSVSWSSRPFAALVTGQVTALPGNGQIEIAHQLYHVKANSAAAKALTSIYIGENVDAVLDTPTVGAPSGKAPAGSTGPEIVILNPHTASS